MWVYKIYLRVVFINQFHVTFRRFTRKPTIDYLSQCHNTCWPNSTSLPCMSNIFSNTGKLPYLKKKKALKMSMNAIVCTAFTKNTYFAYLLLYLLVVHPSLYDDEKNMTSN